MSGGVPVSLFSRRKSIPKAAPHNEEKQLEQEALEKEFAWLLESEYQLKLNAIDKCMEECAKKFSIVLNPSLASGGGDVRPILLSSPQQGDSIFCVASVDGDKISKAEITLKLPGRGNKPLRTTIKEHAAWKLRQVQDSANYFQKAQEKYQSIKANQGSLKTPTEIRRAFANLMLSLRQAEEVMVLPQHPNVQEIYKAEQRSHLKPELPEDVALHFHISASQLVLTILISLQSPKADQGAGTPSEEVDSVSWIGSTFDYGTSTYEVANQIQVQSQVPWLASVLRLLQETLELAQDLIDKVKIFEAIGLPQQPSSSL